MFQWSVFWYSWLMTSMSWTSFICVAVQNLWVRPGRGGWGEVEGSRGGRRDRVATSLLSASSRLRTWLVGVQQIMHPCKWQGEFLEHVFWISWCRVSEVSPLGLCCWRGLVVFIFRVPYNLGWLNQNVEIKEGGGGLEIWQWEQGRVGLPERGGKFISQVTVPRQPKFSAW